MKHGAITRVLAVCLMLGLGCVNGAEAQSFSLKIEGGIVTINGQVLPMEEWPDGLDVKGSEASFRSEGIARPIVGLNGVNYVLDGNRLLALEDIEVVVHPMARFGKGVEPGTHVDVHFVEMAATLQQQAAELERIRLQAFPQALDVLLRMAEESVTEAARAVKHMPVLQLQSYYNDIQAQDGDLYKRLVEESRMEIQAAQLAQAIRALSEGPERELRTEALRETLGEIFALKQHNRKREIKQLEKEVEALSERLQMREAARERLVRQRLRELISTRR